LEADWVTLAIAQGRTGAVPKRVGQAWTKVSEEYEQLAMVLKDDGHRPLLWEFHEGGPAAYTQASTAAGGRAGQPVDLTKCRDSAKLLSAVAWMLDYYEPWIVVVRLEGAAGHHHTTPTSLSTSRGFVALEDWEHEDPTTELVKTIMGRQHAGGRLFVVTGPVNRDLATQFAAVLTGET
jgi:hypothetical protein